MDSDVHGRLNWGCGPDWWAGGRPLWIHADIEDFGQHLVLEPVAPLPFEDGFLEGIVANHSLQCLMWSELDPIVAEFRRVLCTGGRLRVLVPSIEWAIRAWQEGAETWPGFEAISEPWDLDRKFAHYLTWGGWNRTCFTHSTLLDLLERHGFRLPNEGAEAEDRAWDWLLELDSRPGESIVLEVIAP